MVCVCLAYMWVTQPQHLRAKILPNIVIIVLCLKLSHVNDKETARKDAESYVAMREYLDESLKHFQVIPLILMYFLENKIARHYSFGKLFKAKAHLLTTANIVY